MMGTQVHLDMPMQRRGLVAGALDHGDVQPDQGRLEGLRPGRRLAIRRVLLQQKKARHRLQRHQTDLRMEGLILTHREIPVRHALRQRRALLMRDGDQRLLQRRIEALVGTVAGADECRQPAQLKELAHHPHPGTALQGDAEVRRQHQLMQPPHALRGLHPRRQGRGAAPTATGLHHSCKVLRARPRSAATCRCGCPAARRAVAVSSCSARSRRERRFTTHRPSKAVQRAVAPPRVWVKVNPGRTFEHLPSPSVGSHLQGYEISRVLPLSRTAFTMRSTQPWPE
jgi:hypothetical protein